MFYDFVNICVIYYNEYIKIMQQKTRFFMI